MGRAQDSTNAAAAQSRHGQQQRAAWGPTAVQRSYREILDAAKFDAQLIVDSDGTGLVLQLQDSADFTAALRERVTCLAQFLAVRKANENKAASEWANQTDFPYLAAFDEDDIDEFSRELLSYTLDASQRGTLEQLEGNLRAWESTAGIYGQPEVLAAMTADFDPSDIVEVFPPAEEAEAVVE